MNRLFKKEQILTIPNLLSLIRLLMIPLIIRLYVVKEEYVLSVAVIVLSGITDVLDGYIARRFNMVSDLGKIVDPIADKLTQFALIACLYNRYTGVRYLLVLFAVKEIIMAVFGVVVMRKKDSINSAQWFGKATTFVLYATMVILFLFPSVPELYASVMFVVCAAMILMSMVKYLAFYRRLLSE